jgi:hypothetical protein
MVTSKQVKKRGAEFEGEVQEMSGGVTEEGSEKPTNRRSCDECE